MGGLRRGGPASARAPVCVCVESLRIRTLPAGSKARPAGAGGPGSEGECEEKEEERREGLRLGRPGGCVREGGGDREGAGAREPGRRVSLLAERLSRSSVVPLPARRRSSSQQTRPPAPTQAAQPSLGPTPPPGPGRWKAVPRSQLRLLHSGRGNFRPHRVAQRPAPAAEGTTQSRAGVRGAGPRCREGAWPRRGASDLGGAAVGGN